MSIGRTFLIASSAVALPMALAAAAAPSLFLNLQPGLWEISRKGAPPAKLCVADPALFAQFEHRAASCSRSVIRDSGSDAVVTYSCAGGNFGQSELSLLTPRSIRVETQGIFANAPFRYTFQARRLGSCTGH